MPNITLGDYTPPENPINESNFIFGIFFDGTLNNKQNTIERENNTTIYKKNGIKTWKQKQISEKKDTSYDNDWSNIARMSEACKDKIYPIYIEGIGTEDRKGDDTDGFAFGSGSTGIRAKVRKGCEEITKRLVKSNEKKVNTLTLDVYGFSRGAAAARNFVYEVAKSKYKPILYTPPTTGWGTYIEPIPTDSDGNFTALKEFPARGHLGLKLQEAGVNVERIVIRFLGIYDTVSSFHPNFSLSPNFNDDIQQLNLNDIGSAKNVVHFTATDERRKNFDLTHTHIGEERTFPGVHSDIGGSYLSEEEWVREIATDWVHKGRLKPIEDKLIAEGWYTKEQLSYIGGNAYFALTGRRPLLQTYSFIPLKFMVEKANRIKCDQISLDKINQKYDYSKDALLVRVEKRLRSYVFDKGKPYDFKWFNEINEKYKGKESDPNYKEELDEQRDLRTLRGKYLHWSADRYAVGMDPRWNWKRKTH